MTLLIYSQKRDSAEKFLHIVDLLIPEKKLKFFSSIVDLSDELRRPVLSRRIVILFASSKEELEDIISIRELLTDAKIILIVPDANPSTLARGHTLRPRFLCTCNSDFVDIVAVLSQMIKKMQYH